MSLFLKNSSFQTVFFVAISFLRGSFCKIMCNSQQSELDFHFLKPTKVEPLEVLVVLEVSKYGFHILRSLTAIFQTFVREQLFTFSFLDFPQTMVYLYNPFRPACVTPALNGQPLQLRALYLDMVCTKPLSVTRLASWSLSILCPIGQYMPSVSSL